MVEDRTMKKTLILENPSKNEIINVIHQNGTEFWRNTLEYYLKDDFLRKNSNLEYSLDNDVSFFFTGIKNPFGNAIWGANFTEQEAQEKVSIILNKVIRNKIPIIWWVGSVSKPNNLGDYLVKTGLIKHESLGMYLILKELEIQQYQQILDKTKIQIERVSTPKSEKQWSDLCSTLFNMSEVKEEIDQIWRLYYKFCDVYLATLEGQPVGASLGFYGSGVVGIYNVCVYPEYRKQGIGTALTMAPLLQAKKKGYEISILMASSMAINLYKHIGYKECCNYRFYIYTPDNPKEV